MAEQIEQQPLLIIGSGALACLFAARLSAAGHPVNMLGSWQDGLAALNERGVTLVAGDQEQTYAVSASTEPRDFAGARYALVLVKSWQTQRAAAQLSDCLAEDGLALTLQNGLGNREALVAALGERRVALGATTTGATLLNPGRVLVGGPGVITLADRPDVKLLAEILVNAGFEVELSADVDALLWGKLVVNAAINPLTAMLELPNGALIENSSFTNLMRGLAEEVAEVAVASGVSLTLEDPAAAAELVARRTAANKSSMLQDVLRGAPTEIDAICGAVVRAAKASGVSAPLNELMWKLVESKVRLGAAHENG